MTGCTTGLACCAWAFSPGLCLCSLSQWPAWLLADVSESAARVLEGFDPEDCWYESRCLIAYSHTDHANPSACWPLTHDRIWPERTRDLTGWYFDALDAMVHPNVCALLPAVPRCAPPPVVLANEAHRCTEVDTTGPHRCDLLAGHGGMHRHRGPGWSIGWGR